MWRLLCTAGCLVLAAGRASDELDQIWRAPDVRQFPKDLNGLARAHALHARSTTISLDYGLNLERSGQIHDAEQVLIRAAGLDRHYLPAWTLANFYYRQHRAAEYWPWARRAAEICPDDLKPLLRLSERMDPAAAVIVERLGGGPRVLREYLDLLIGDNRWEEAKLVAAQMRRSPAGNDTARVAEFERRLAESGRK